MARMEGKLSALHGEAKIHPLFLLRLLLYSTHLPTPWFFLSARQPPSLSNTKGTLICDKGTLAMQGEETGYEQKDCYGKRRKNADVEKDDKRGPKD